jgi:hypothetical protein
MSLNIIILPARSGLTRRQRAKRAILRQWAVRLGLMSERDARYEHDDERAVRKVGA